MKKPVVSMAGVPNWLIAAGVNALLILLVGAGAAGILYVFNLASSISVPFVIAAVLAIISFPLIEFGDKLKLPRALSAIIVLLLFVVVVWVSIQITVVGIADQAPSIGSELVNGIESLGKWTAGNLERFGVSEEEIARFFENVSEATSKMFSDPGSLIEEGGEDGSPLLTSGSDIFKQLTGMLAAGGKGLSGVLKNVGSLAFGTFIGAMLLYYMLTDYEKLVGFTGRHLGVSPELGAGLVDDASAALRGYFRGTTITAVFVTLGIGIGLSIFKVKLIIPIMIVTFLTSYIPFFGAIISAAFACLIALASGGFPAAIAALVIVLIMQNLLQQVVQAKFLGDSLEMHPIAVLVSTVGGGVFGGLLGATLAAPILSMVMRAYKRLAIVEEIEESGGTLEDLRELLSVDKGDKEPLFKIPLQFRKHDV